MFHTLTPPFVLEAYAANRLQETSTAVCLFVDTAGFTPLTSALMAYGAEGAEVLAQVLAEIFTPLLTIVYEQGGYVAGFAGDAFKAIFPGLSADSHQRALTAAWQIRQQMLAHPNQTTRFGDFGFAVKLTVASGPVEWRILRAGATATGVTQQAALFFGGAALAQALAADPLVKAGEIVLTAAVAEQLPTTAATLTPVADHFRLDDWALNPPSAPHPSSPTLHSPPAAPGYLPLASHFFPTELLERQTQGEFRQVVTVFVNLQTLPSGATATNLVTAFFQLLTQYGGYLCRIGQIGERDPGGTLLFFWGAPTSHENDVARALHFALAVQSVAPMPVRIGITTSLAYAGFVGSPWREEYTCYGAHVNLAARQMVMAGWGEIWLDPATAQLAGAAFSIIEQAQLRFKGFSEERTVYRLVGRRESGTENLYQGALVGRQAELSQLVTALAPLAAGKFAGILTISGEAGLGKSRLVYELQNWTRLNAAEHGSQKLIHVQPRLAASNSQWFFCQTDEILRQPLNPLRYWLRSYFNQATGADEATNKAIFANKLDNLTVALAASEADEQLKAQSQTLQAEIARTRSFLGALIDLHWPDSLYAQVEPQLRFENTLAALKTLILAESLRQPVILHLEDAHWLDADSQTFLARLLHNVADYPLALIVTRRPGEETGRQGDKETRREGDKESFAGEAPQLTIELTTLTAAEITALAAAQLQGAPAPALVRLIEERAEGNPFFVEQLLHYLREQGWLVQGAAGWQLRPELAPTTILPNGARALLVARLDQLPQPVKEVVQTAAVLGREFDTNVLARMLADDTRLADKLAVAGQAAIWSAIHQARYLFRHALLRETAYEMQLRARLRSLHQLAGAALEQIYAADLTPHLGELAYHYDQAEAAEQAVQWYGQAGEQASKQYANETAARYFHRALALTPAQDAARRYPLLLGSEAAHNWLGRRQPQQEDLMTLEAVTAQLNDDAKRSEVLLRKTAFHLSTGRYQEATGYAEQAVAFAVQAGDTRAEARAYHRWGRAFWQAGDYQQARPHLTRALQLARVTKAIIDEAQSLYDLSVIDYYEKTFTSALEQVKQALHLFESIDDQRGKIYCLSLNAIILSDMGHYVEATAQFEVALRLCRQIGLRSAEAPLLAQSGDNNLNLGALTSAYHQHIHALQIYQEIDNQERRAASLDTLGILLTFLNRLEEAQNYYQEALIIHRLMQDRRGEGYVLTHLGYLFLQEGAWQKAADVLEQALALRRIRAEKALLLDTLAAYAWAVRGLDQAAAALPYVDEILASLKHHGTAGVEFPGQVYLICYRILNDVAQSDVVYQPRALQALADGYAFLQERAARIQDITFRQNFFQNIPFHRELIALWQANVVSATHVLSHEF